MSSTVAMRHAGPRSRVLTVLAVTAALVLSGLGWPPAASAATPTTYMGHLYASTATPPTADKPQSKLWYHDGAWWGLLINSGGTLVHIHELMPDHTWRNTGALVDNRPNSTGDALWDADRGELYIASRDTTANLQVNKFGYNAANRSWTTAAGFPVSVNTGGGSESAAIDRDSQNRLWVTWTRGGRVWVARSDSNGTNWVNVTLPPEFDTAIANDDLSSVVAFGNSIGVMWSDQVAGVFRFAVHRDSDPDGVWTLETALEGPGMSDDHINLKQLSSDSQGRIFAAVKTSRGDADTDPTTDPLVGVLTRTPGAAGGTWKFAPAGTVADDHSRPILMIDETHQTLYFFATAPVSGGDIFYKTAPLSNIDFSNQPGRGTPFVNATPVVNNASGAKHPVTAQTGLVILAVAHGKKQYVHAEMALDGGSTPVDPAPTVTSTSPASAQTDVAASTNVTATFSEAVQGVSGSTFQLKDAAGTVVSATVAGSGNQWVLDPAADLAAGATYSATLTGGSTAIRDSANQPLTTTTWSFTVAGTAPVDAPPTVTGTSPADGATGVGVSSNVTATFSEAVTGVSASTFTLQPAAGGAAVSATVSYSATYRKATLNPSANLAAGTQYTATLSSGIRDAGGNALSPVSWSFTTATATNNGAPRVTKTAPASGAVSVGPAANVTATFSEAVQGVDTTTFTLRSPAGALVSATVSRSGTTNTWILNPASNLAKDTVYTATLTGGSTAIRDLTNVALTTYSWSFLTGPAPTVSGKSPGVNATGVSRAVTVAATFNEAVQGVDGTTFLLSSSAGNVTATVTRSGTTNKYLLDPAADLAPNTQYTVTVIGGATAIRDLAGNPLKTVSWKFTTGA